MRFCWRIKLIYSWRIKLICRGSSCVCAAVGCCSACEKHLPTCVPLASGGRATRNPSLRYARASWPFFNRCKYVVIVRSLCSHSCRSELPSGCLNLRRQKHAPRMGSDTHMHAHVRTHRCTHTRTDTHKHPTHNRHLLKRIVACHQALLRGTSTTLARALSAWQYQVFQQRRLERVSTVLCVSHTHTHTHTHTHDVR
jgi:hypothetical protein